MSSSKLPRFQQCEVCRGSIDTAHDSFVHRVIHGKNLFMHKPCFYQMIDEPILQLKVVE